MTRQRRHTDHSQDDHSQDDRSPAELQRVPSKSHAIQLYKTAIEDMQHLQRAIEGLLQQQGQTLDSQRELEQALSNAKSGKEQARQDLAAFTLTNQAD